MNLVVTLRHYIIGQHDRHDEFIHFGWDKSASNKSIIKMNPQLKIALRNILLKYVHEDETLYKEILFSLIECPLQ